MFFSFFSDIYNQKREKEDEGIDFYILINSSSEINEGESEW